MAGSRHDAQEDRDAWDAVAGFWHERMGEGNDFVETLIWPRVRRLLPPLRGARILDVGCGNGLYARKLAGEGARVMGVDYSVSMIARAKDATPDLDVEYAVMDASVEEGLKALPSRAFDAVLTTMVLMDMSDVGPLFRCLPRILRPNGTIVFATAHPSFNSAPARREIGSDGLGEIHVLSYRTASRATGAAIRGQPALTASYHRTLADLLRPAFAAGLVLDALEEPSFPPTHPHGSREDSWGGRYHEFPPVLVGRLRVGVT